MLITIDLNGSEEESQLGEVIVIQDKIVAETEVDEKWVDPQLELQLEIVVPTPQVVPINIPQNQVLP